MRAFGCPLVCLPAEVWPTLVNSPDPDHINVLIADGEQAARLVGPLRREVEHRTGVVVTRLVAEYRNKSLTGKRAMLAVAEIAGLRSLLSDLESKARQGQEAFEKLH